MGGGLLQIVAYGLNDTMLTGNPQISFFKTVFRKHTNFYKESIEQIYSGDVRSGNKIGIKLSKQGDLLSGLLLEFKEITYDTVSCIDYVEFYVGDVLVQKFNSHWLNLWLDLTLNKDKTELMNVIRRGTLNYVIPELKNESNPIFVPNLKVNEIREYPVPDQRSIRSMYHYDMFIYITQDNGIDGESWISRLTVSLNYDTNVYASQTINNTYKEKFIQTPNPTPIDNITTTKGLTIHKNKLYIADTVVINNETIGVIDVHTLDTNPNSNSYGNITDTNPKLVGSNTENSEVEQFNRDVPYISPFGRNNVGFYIGTISAMCSNEEYIILSNDSSPHYLYKMYTDFGNYRYKYNIEDLTPSTITFFGKGISGYRNGSAAISTFNKPYGIAVYEEIDNETGEFLFTDIYIADRDNHVIRKWNRLLSETVTIAGNMIEDNQQNQNVNSIGFVNGDAASSRFNLPEDLCITKNGRFLFVADKGNYCVRKIDTFANTNQVTTLAGNNTIGHVDGNGINATFGFITAIVIDTNDKFLYVSDNDTAPNSNHCLIRKISTSSGEVTTLFDSNDNTNVNFSYITALAIDPFSSYLLIGDTNRLYKLDLLSNNELNLVKGRIELLSGAADNTAGNESAPNGGLIDARFNNIGGIFIDYNNEFALISDTENHVIKKLYIKNFINPSLILLTGGEFNSNDTPEGQEDGYPRYDAQALGFAKFHEPRGIYINNLSNKSYVIDTLNHKVREIHLADREEKASTFFIEQLTSSLRRKVKFIVNDSAKNIYIIYDNLPGIYKITVSGIDPLNTEDILIPLSDNFIKLGNGLSIKDDILYIPCKETNKVYQYDINSPEFLEINNNVEDIEGPTEGTFIEEQDELEINEDNNNEDNNNEDPVTIVSPSSIIITYFNDVLVSESGDNAKLKVIGKAKPYYIYHDIYDYQQAAYLDLPFWFSKEYNALPLISIPNEEIKLVIKLSDNIDGITSMKIWGDYIFLDESEKNRFINDEHYYLFEQIQHSETQRIADKTVRNSQPLSVYSIVDLDFNNNVKELIWTLFQTHYGESGVKKSCSVENNGGNQNIEVDSLFIQINGQDIIQEHPGKYFTDFQRYKYHRGQGIKLTRIGVNDDDVTSTRVLSKWFPRVINQHIFSFALKPEESQPSGSINFSLVDSSTMNIKFKTSAVDGRQSYDLDVYAISYNVLKIKNGLVSLVYSS